MKLSAWWVIIDNEKRILLIKRSAYTNMFPHHWGIPAWRWEEWETPEQIVIREVFEEVWLIFEPIQLYLDWIWEHSWNPINYNRFLWNWSWKVNIQDKECDWYAWYTYEETKNLKIAFNYREMIEKLFNDWFII